MPVEEPDPEFAPASTAGMSVAGAAVVVVVLCFLAAVELPLEQPTSAPASTATAATPPSRRARYPVPEVRLGVLVMVLMVVSPRVALAGRSGG